MYVCACACAPSYSASAVLNYRAWLFVPSVALTERREPTISKHMLVDATMANFTPPTFLPCSRHIARLFVLFSPLRRPRLASVGVLSWFCLELCHRFSTTGGHHQHVRRFHHGGLRVRGDRHLRGWDYPLPDGLRGRRYYLSGVCVCVCVCVCVRAFCNSIVRANRLTIEKRLASAVAGQELEMFFFALSVCAGVLCRV